MMNTVLLMQTSNNGESLSPRQGRKGTMIPGGTRRSAIGAALDADAHATDGTQLSVQVGRWKHDAVLCMMGVAVWLAVYVSMCSCEPTTDNRVKIVLGFQTQNPKHCLCVCLVQAPLQHSMKTAPTQQAHTREHYLQHMMQRALPTAPDRQIPCKSAWCFRSCQGHLMQHDLVCNDSA